MSLRGVRGGELDRVVSPPPRISGRMLLGGGRPSPKSQAHEVASGCEVSVNANAVTLAVPVVASTKWRAGEGARLGRRHGADVIDVGVNRPGAGVEVMEDGRLRRCHPAVEVGGAAVSV